MIDAVAGVHVSDSRLVVQLQLDYNNKCSWRDCSHDEKPCGFHAIAKRVYSLMGASKSRHIYIQRTTIFSAILAAYGRLHKLGLKRHVWYAQSQLLGSWRRPTAVVEQEPKVIFWVVVPPHQMKHWPAITTCVWSLETSLTCTSALTSNTTASECTYFWLIIPSRVWAETSLMFPWNPISSTVSVFFSVIKNSLIIVFPAYRTFRKSDTYNNSCFISRCFPLRTPCSVQRACAQFYIGRESLLGSVSTAFTQKRNIA